jgi:hypothetical protein
MPDFGLLLFGVHALQWGRGKRQPLSISKKKKVFLTLTFIETKGFFQTTVFQWGREKDNRFSSSLIKKSVIFSI